MEALSDISRDIDSPILERLLPVYSFMLTVRVLPGTLLYFSNLRSLNGVFLVLLCYMSGDLPFQGMGLIGGQRAVCKFRYFHRAIPLARYPVESHE